MDAALVNLHIVTANCVQKQQIGLYLFISFHLRDNVIYSLHSHGSGESFGGFYIMLENINIKYSPHPELLFSQSNMDV